MQTPPSKDPATPSRDPATEVNHDFITPLGYYDDADQMLLENATWPEWGTGFEGSASRTMESYDLLEAGTWVSVTTPVVCVGCLGDEERRLKYEWGTGLGIPSDIKPQRPHRVEPGTTGELRVMRHTVQRRHWSGRTYTNLPPRFQCYSCATARQRIRTIEDANRRAWDRHERECANAAAKRARDDKQASASKRLKSLDSDNGSDATLINKLKNDALKRLCAVNELPVSGTKQVLVDRLIGVRVHGRPAAPCQRCNRNGFKPGKFELEYGPGSSTAPAEPIAVACKSNLKTRPCFTTTKITSATKATVLAGKLCDSAEGDLAKVGIELSESVACDSNVL